MLPAGMHASVATFSVLISLPLLVLATTSDYVIEWDKIASQSATSKGDGTYYGDGQDYQGACSYGTNFANANGEPWGTGAEVTIAMNDYQFANSGMCGTCVIFRGTGGDRPNMGTQHGKSLQDKQWHKAHVTNKCPECAPGDIDLCKDGDGRWLQEWYAVPCEVGDTKLKYHIPNYTPYWISMVITNHRYPIRNVAITWPSNGNNWITLPRTVNNQFPYYGTYGTLGWPVKIQITSVTGEVIVDEIASSAGGWGTKQFSIIGSSQSAAAPAPAPRPAFNISANATASNSTSNSTSPAASNSTSTAAAPVASGIAVANTFTVVPGGQCGGKGLHCADLQGPQTQCMDAKWTGAVCQAPYQCNRRNEWWWDCTLPGSGSSGGAGASFTDSATAGR